MRLNYNDDLKNIIGYLADETLIDDDGEFIIVFLRIKDLNIVSRELLRKLWEQYDAPGLAFLENIADQSLLVNTIKMDRFYNGLFNTVGGMSILSPGFEQDVFRLRSNR